MAQPPLSAALSEGMGLGLPNRQKDHRSVGAPYHGRLGARQGIMLSDRGPNWKLEAYRAQPIAPQSGSVSSSDKLIGDRLKKTPPLTWRGS